MGLYCDFENASLDFRPLHEERFSLVNITQPFSRYRNKPGLNLETEKSFKRSPDRKHSPEKRGYDNSIPGRESQSSQKPQLGNPPAGQIVSDTKPPGYTRRGPSVTPRHSLRDSHLITHALWEARITESRFEDQESEKKGEKASRRVLQNRHSLKQPGREPAPRRPR